MLCEHACAPSAHLQQYHQGVFKKSNTPLSPWFQETDFKKRGFFDVFDLYSSWLSVMQLAVI